MALELENLVFSVSTGQLDDARIKLAKLGDAVNALNKPMQDMARSSAKTNEVIAKSELAAEKARQAQKTLAEEVQDAGEKMSRVEKNLQKVTTGLQIFRGETVNVKDASVNLGDSFTKSQANFLAMQLQLGATAEQLKSFAKEFTDFNKMTSTNTFDNSIRGLNKLKQETKELAEVDKLMREGVSLTKDQIVNLTRDSERLTQAYKSMKKTDEELSSALIKLREDTIEAAKAKNTFIEAAKQSEIQAKREAESMLENARAAKLVNDKMMQNWSAAQGTKSPALQEMSNFYKEQERLLANGMTTMDQAVLKYRELEAARNKASSPRSISEQAAAEAYLAKETERVNRLIEAKGEITSSTNNRLIKYEQALKASGVSSEVAAAKLAKYKEQLLETQKVAGNRQMDYLSRALGPQITDIFVGLATGQNPMTVLLQQGGQLRDQFALAGVEGANMGKALTTAFTNMYDSTKNVAIAVGTMLVDGFIKLGLAATTVVSKMTGDFYIVGKSTEFLIKNLSGLITLFPALETAIIGLGEAINFSIGAGVIALFAGLAIAFKQIVNEEGELSRALLTTGAALGFSKQSAIEFAQSLDGVSESKVKNFLTELAKNSVENTGNLKELTKTAVDLEKYAGISLDETAKKYAELQKKPVDGLVKLATETGRVSVATLKHAEDLKEAKKYTELATLANEEFARSYKEVAAATEKDLSPIERIFKTISDEASSGWNAFKEWANTPEVLEVVKTAWTAFSVVLKTVVASVKQVITGIGSVISAIKNLAGLNFSAALDSVVSGYENVQKIGAEYTADVKNTLGGNYYGASSTTKGGMSPEELAANARAAKAFEQQKKDREEARKKAESEAKKLLEQQKKDMDVYNDLMNKAEGQNKAYNNSLESLNRLRKEGKITQEQYNDAFGYLVRSQPGYVKQMQELTQAAEEYDKAVKDVAKTVKEWSDSADVEAEKLNLRQKLLGLSAEEQARVNAEYDKYSKLKKLDLDLENALNAAKSKFTTEDFELVQKPKIIAANAKLRENVERESSIKIAEQQIEEFNKTRDAISGAIADALFEGGKKGADSLKNYLKTTFRNYVIKVFIEPIVGNLLSSLGVKGGAGRLGDFASIVNQGGGLFGGYSSGLGNSIISAGNTAGRWLYDMGFEKAGEALVNTFNSVSEAGQTISSVGNYAGDALAYLNAFNTALKNPYAGAGQAIGYYFGGPLGSYIGGEIGKAVGDLMGWSGGDPDAYLVQQAVGTTQRYTTSTTSRLGTVGFVNGNATIMKNGRLISEYGETEAVPSDFQRSALATIQALDNAIAATMSESQIKETMTALSGWYRKSWDFEGQMLEGWLTSRYETILRGLDSAFGSVSDYRKEGEKLTDTVVRLIGNLTTVRNTFESLGISTEIVTAKFATNLADMLGGISNFSSSMQFFYENFFSEEEKMQRATEGLTKAFAAMNLTVPETKQQFRELLEGALSSGNLGLSSSLIALMQPFNDFIAKNEELAQSVNETVDSIQQEINRLRGENLRDSIVQGTALRAEFDIMSALARGGDITALAKLPEFSQAIEKNMTDFASSASDVIFARALLAQSLSDTMSSLGGNTTIVPTSVSGLAGSTSIATTGAADLTASVTSQGDLVSVLIAEIQGLRAEVRADVSANTKTSKILERANQDGETLSVTVVA